ncbi:MAG: hypothetical protein [Circular genetic element sp.]|nr:MAG: hypothetical protein [Circular genetic element sp.]
MNELVLEDNPSIAGKWADYKVYLEPLHRTATNLTPLLITPGEWAYSTYTLPQHDVDPVTGQPLAADITRCHLIGTDVGVPGAFLSIGLVKAYQDTRATVFDNNPNVPAGFADSFFNLLTDSGSQEPELAGQIEFENDDPPYDLDNYPGAGVNGGLVPQHIQSVSVGQPDGHIGAFTAECGLLKVTVSAFSATGVVVPAPTMSMIVTLMPGKYKGVAAIKMGQ